MSDEELKNRYLALWDAIHVADCFGSRDLIEMEAIAQELEKRGYEVTEVCKPRIRKVRKA